MKFIWYTCRHGICQKVYTCKVFKDQILPKSAEISMNARLGQNSVNDGDVKNIWGYI